MLIKFFICCLFEGYFGLLTEFVFKEFDCLNFLSLRASMIKRQENFPNLEYKTHTRNQPTIIHIYKHT